jgi:hypothetical protein
MAVAAARTASSPLWRHKLIKSDFFSEFQADIDPGHTGSKPDQARKLNCTSNALEVKISALAVAAL